MAQSVTVGNGGNKNVRTIRIGNGGNKNVIEGWIGTAGGNRQFFAGLTATKSGDATAPQGQSFTNDVTITPADGVSPYSYSWARASGDTDHQISSTTAQTVAWSHPSLPPNPTSSTWNCTVTDQHGSITVVAVLVNFAGQGV